MPRYRMKYQSKSKPSLHRMQIVNSTSVRVLVKRLGIELLNLTIKLKLPDDDFDWTIERESGHLDGWEIAAHNRDSLTQGHG